jgi:septal ring-binding cell division protein DamX
MLKQLAAIGIGAALILAPVASFAQTATPTPAATTAPVVKKIVKHHVVKHHVVKKPVAAKPMVKHHVVKHHAVKKPIPTPTPTKS